MKRMRRAFWCASTLKQTLIDLMEAMRYRDTRARVNPKSYGSSGTSRVNRWQAPILAPAGSVMWLDQGKPWAYFNLEELIYNVDVSTYIRQRGH